MKNCIPGQARLLPDLAAREALLTTRELADWLRVSPRTIESWVATRRIPYFKVFGRTVRFKLQDVRVALLRGEEPK